jgi:FMN phosphatase YigB (HAD superfamily)
MPLSLEQYASYLDTRKDLPWPAPPQATPVKARSHLARLSGVRAVLWNVYGTLLAIPQGELLFEHPTAFIMSNALDKTIQEFKMWGSMSRKPGQPSEYMQTIYTQILTEQRSSLGGGERFPEVASERVWEAILKRLLQKDYKFDAGFYGSINELSRKVAYFFHASLQGTACYGGAASAMRHVRDRGLAQGLLADGQCFTAVQLQRGLDAQGGGKLEDLLDDSLVVLSCDVRGRKPSERLFRQALQALAERGIEPGEVLHVGSRLALDLVPAKRLGMRTALFAGDKASLQATPEQLKEPASRPDVLLTELDQITEVIAD